MAGVEEAHPEASRVTAEKGVRMYPFMIFTKLSVILMLCASGIFFLSRGFGMPIPYLEYGALEAWNIPAGALLLAAGVSFGFFWKLTHGETRHESQGDDGHWVHGTTTRPHHGLKH